MVSFEDGRLWILASALTSMDARGKQEAEEVVQRLAVHGTTNLSGGLLEGLTLLASQGRSSAVSSVFLLTDGCANCGIQDTPGIVSAVSGARSQIQGVLNSGCSVFTFGFGSDHDANMLSAISDSAEGIYYSVATPEKIPESFGDALGGLLSVAAQNVKLTITAVGGARIAAVETKYKVKHVQEETCSQVTLGDLYAEERKNVLLQLGLTQTDAPQSAAAVALVRCEYFDVKHNQMEVKHSEVTVARPVAEAAVAVDAVVGTQVQRMVAVRCMAQAREAANAGQYQEGRRLLQAGVQKIKAGPWSMEADRLLADLLECHDLMVDQQTYTLSGTQTLSSTFSGLWQERSTGSNCTSATFTTRSKTFHSQTIFQSVTGTCSAHWQKRAVAACAGGAGNAGRANSSSPINISSPPSSPPHQQPSSPRGLGGSWMLTGSQLSSGAPGLDGSWVLPGLSPAPDQATDRAGRLHRLGDDGYRVCLHDLEISGDYLQHNASGWIRKARHRPSNLPVLVKTLRLPGVDRAEHRQMAEELRGLRARRCPRLVICHDAFQEDGTMYLVLEHMDGGDLSMQVDMHRDSGIQSEVALANIGQQMLEGLDYMHRHHQLHRDLRPSEVWLTTDGKVKIADFDVSADLGQTMALAATFVGTPAYMSPERLSGEHYSFPSDIWSFGLILLELILGRHPYPPQSNYFQLLSSVIQGAPPTVPDRCSPELRDFVALCLQKDPAQRPNTADLLQHPWLTREPEDGSSDWLVPGQSAAF